MQNKRPTIPIDIQRAIFVEAGHRCACCGAQFPLERAHIVPWSKSKDHAQENLLCLCANCHQMADNDWDHKTFYLYKQNPWVNRQNRKQSDPLKKEEEIKISTDSPINIQGETILFEEKMISIGNDVVKIYCHTHRLGVLAEHLWLNRKYPNSECVSQALTSFNTLTGDKSQPDRSFDIIEIQLEDGSFKTVFFDISEFFTGKGTSEISTAEFMAEKLRRLYQS